MAKHRDLAQIVHAKTISRTVVVAGAMLGAPLIASAQPPAPPPQYERGIKPAQSATKAELAKQAAEVVKAIAAELVALDKSIATATTAVSNAENQDRDAATAKLTNLKTTKIELKARQTAAKAEQKKADAATKADANANKAKPRPRTQDDVRPKGRGFVLG